jgi:RHS repeat-associated protein
VSVDRWLPDGHGGRVSSLSNAQGSLVERYEHRAFGEPRIFGANGGEQNQSQVGLSLLVLGQPYEQTGLQRFGARWYRPALGQFITADPLGFADGPNRFGFVDAKPLAFADPTGLYRCAFTDQVCAFGRDEQLSITEPDYIEQLAAREFPLLVHMIPFFGPYWDTMTFAARETLALERGDYWEAAKMFGLTALSAATLALDLASLGAATFGAAQSRKMVTLYADGGSGAVPGGGCWDRGRRGLETR